MLILIKGGRVIDPGNLDGIMDILIADGKIVEIKKHGSADGEYPEAKIIEKLVLREWLRLARFLFLQRWWCLSY